MTNSFRIGAESAHDLKLAFVGMCSNGHAMADKKGSERATATCGICAKALKDVSPGTATVSHCAKCSFDICSQCIGACGVLVREGSLVTVTADYKDHGDASGGPLEPGKYGTVMKDDKSDKPFKVRLRAVPPH